MLELDVTAEHAGRQLCEFVYTRGVARCADLDSIPKVEVTEILPSAMASEARAAVLRATGMERLPPYDCPPEHPCSKF